ncbi:MAG: DNA internalization-related competence protein ComEC/Rec2 [Burkholderiales bacterium]|nr:DNA internalization-related competence protein ComEC/Rec2 [Burkholderiales bacterium]
MRLFALAFLLGTATLQHQGALPAFDSALPGLALLLAAGLLARERRVPLAMLLAVAGGLLGFGHAAWRAELRLADELPFRWEGADVEVVGVISGLPQPAESGTRFAFAVEEIRTAGAVVPRDVALTWYRERSPKASGVPRLAAGERWRFTVRLKRPRGLANPHAFDFEPWALERGIRATGYVRTLSRYERVDARVEGWPYTLHRWRGEIREAMLAHLSANRMRGVVVALAIGDHDAIASDDWEVFWRTGVGHLMSISGLHITMLAAAAFAVAFFAWVRVPPLALYIPARKAAVVAGVLAALAYALMTGYAVPAQRTLLMLATLAACVLADRHGAPSRVLALAALIVVLADPWAVLSAGFWLSFGAVASIFYVMSLRAGRRGRLHAAYVEQLAVTVAMMPMLLALFQEFSLVSPIANAFAIPVVSLVVVPLAICGAFLPLPFLLDVAHAVMLALMSPLERLAELPFAMLESHEPAAWSLMAGVVGCAWLLAPRGIPMRSLGAAWVAPMFTVAPQTPAQGEAWLDVLDVGNGLAVSVRTSHHAIVYDTGPGWSADADSGSRIVVPFLRGEGIRTLDGMVVSHADDDHSGGAISIAGSRAPPWLLSSVPPADPIHLAFERSIRCEAGQRWRWDGVDFEILHPAAAMYDETGRRKENDRGCVLKVSTASASALLAGDVEARAEAEMLARDPGALRADLVLVPHHGSKTSSTPAFVAAVAPRYALVSVGYRNRFKHPNAAVLARYAAIGSRILRTDEGGALRAVLPAFPSQPLVVRAYAERARYWSDRRPHSWIDP